MDGLLKVLVFATVALASPDIWWQRIVNFQDVIQLMSYSIQMAVQSGYELVGEPVLAVTKQRQPETHPGYLAEPGNYAILIVGDASLSTISAQLRVGHTELAEIIHESVPAVLEFHLTQPSDLSLEVKADKCLQPVCPLALLVFRKAHHNGTNSTADTVGTTLSNSNLLTSRSGYRQLQQVRCRSRKTPGIGSPSQRRSPHCTPNRQLRLRLP